MCLNFENNRARGSTKMLRLEIVLAAREALFFAAFVLSVFVPLSVEEEIKFSSDFNAEDLARFELLKLSDITGKELRFALDVNKTNIADVEPQVHQVLNNLTASLKKIKHEIFLLRDEVLTCGNVSNINKCKAWKQVFNCCISNIDAEIYAITTFANIVVAHAKMIRDFKHEIRLKPMDLALLKKALGELNYAKRQLSSGQLSEECRRVMKKIPGAWMTFGKTLTFARNFVQMLVNQFEKGK